MVTGSPQSVRNVFSATVSQSRFTHARLFSTPSARMKQRLVILGSGWGGYEVLRGVDKKRWDVTVISPTSHFAFTPFLAGCAVGTLEFRCAMEPVRKYGREITAYQAWCDSIDFGKRQLTCTITAPSDTPVPPTSQSDIAITKPSSFTVKYDKLVISVGAYSQTFGIPGVKEHAVFLKGVSDARVIRSRIIECFEQASQPTLTDIQRRKLLNFCIVGGGPTGVEFAAELHDLLRTEIPTHYPALSKLARITLYDVAPHILGSFDENLVKYAEGRFAREGITLRNQHHVEKVEKGSMIVKEQGKVDFGLLVWSTGLAPNPFIESLDGVMKDPKTQSVLTDEHLNILNEDGSPNPSVWAIGDAAVIKGNVLPATAQVAGQKARYVTKKLNKIIRDKPSPSEFVFRNMGSLAYLGNWRAIYDRSQATDSGPKRSESGRIAWLLWRSAYITMTLSWRNKILVPFYWFMNWAFGRDLSRF
ncbi:FAD/NAD(P)-binding domain-containing protein [Sistotremastrum suecicum HHB10207 ss-3]|uniref:FAD/NAD(P)-binding domain-containing protein n=1 Tax=Sistotremastrum suecicum HHB10207 ss-3 TaxID=1314776 RepID=A0A166DY51_9AGAM|nr:FAD/NAD(P)-binding domain-containing protein [Sistotremastrum suecicum HHB10207 ss-3]